MSDYAASFTRRVKDALKLLPPGFDRREVEKSVAHIDVRGHYRSRRSYPTDRHPRNERERKAVERVAKAHRRLIYALRNPATMEFSRRLFGPLPEREQRQAKLEAVNKRLKPRRDANLKRRAVEEAAYLMKLAGLRLTTTANGTFVRLAEALAGEPSGIRHHVAQYLNPKIRTEDT